MRHLSEKNLRLEDSNQKFKKKIRISIQNLQVFKANIFMIMVANQQLD